MMSTIPLFEACAKNGMQREDITVEEEQSSMNEVSASLKDSDDVRVDALAQDALHQEVEDMLHQEVEDDLQRDYQQEPQQNLQQNLQQDFQQDLQHQSMVQGYTSQQLTGAIEALLFVTDEPVGVLTFADVLQVEPHEAQDALVRLQQSLEQENRGIQLREVAGGWRLYTHPQYHDLIERYVLSWDTRKLSQAALETLAVVAYCQPITRNGIASVRGVNSDSSVNSLVEKGLLREAGTQDTPGNPVLYATTRTFLEKFGLRSVADLPPLESFAPDEETREFIAERLNVVRPDDDNLLGTNDDGSLGTNDDDLFAARDGGALGTDNTYQQVIHAESMQEAMQAMLSDALAASAGAVEKINFDELVFDEDD